MSKKLDEMIEKMAKEYIVQLDHSDYERVHEITFTHDRKKITLCLDRIELQELIGVLELIKEMKL
jgi:hypothetical protein